MCYAYLEVRERIGCSTAGFCFFVAPKGTRQADGRGCAQSPFAAAAAAGVSACLHTLQATPQQNKQFPVGYGVVSKPQTIVTCYTRQHTLTLTLTHGIKMFFFFLFLRRQAFKEAAFRVETNKWKKGDELVDDGSERRTFTFLAESKDEKELWLYQIRLGHQGCG